MEVRVLGPVEVLVDAKRVDLPAGNERALLALLALHPGETVATGRIVDALWPDDPPASARDMIRMYAARLRKRLGAEAISGSHGGYTLHVDRTDVDAHRFEDLRLKGLRALERGDAHSATSSLDEALSLWRGPPFAGVGQAAFAAEEARRLEELRLAATEDSVQAALDLGRAPELIATLDSLVREHPYRERLRGQLMLALYRSSRQAEALDRYREGRTRLAEDLAIEPGAELRRLEQAILRQDPSLDLPSPPEVPRVRTTSDGRTRRRVAIAFGLALLAAGALAVWSLERSSGGIGSLSRNSLGEVDARSGAILARASIDGVPGAVTADSHGVWVADGAHRVLYEFDPTGLHLRRTIGLAAPAFSLVRTPWSIWIGNGFAGTLTRIGPGDFISPPLLPEPRSTGRLALAFGDGALWVGSQDGALSRLDPRDGRLIARIRGIATPAAVTVTQTAVWVAQATRAELARIDPTTNRLERPVPIGSFASSLAVGAHSIWATSPADDHVWRIASRTGVVTAAIHIAGHPSAVAVADRKVWVASPSAGTLFRIDPQTNRIAQIVHLRRPLAGIATSGSSLWVSAR